MNHTSETGKQYMPPVEPRKPHCGWCISTHIADITCSCSEPCGQGHCAAPDESEPWRL